MSIQKALVHKSQGIAEVDANIPLPTLQDDYILVRTKAVALNPADWKGLEYQASPGAIAGCDYAGVVEDVGKAVIGLKVGDKVAGMVQGGVEFRGAFAEHISAKGNIQIKIPDSLSFEDAATLGAGIITLNQALYQSLGLPFPPEKVQEPTSILIYGASTATGTLAVQFAKLSGLEVIALASSHNFDLLRERGADHVFDYRTPDVGAKIRELTNDKLALVMDCIAEGSSPSICAEAIGSAGGKYTSLGRVEEFPRKDVSNAFTIAYTAFGDDLNLGAFVVPAKPEDLDSAIRIKKLTESLLKEGKLKLHPAKVLPGGLAGIPEGLKQLKDGVSGVKLVYRIE